MRIAIAMIAVITAGLASAPFAWAAPQAPDPADAAEPVATEEDELFVIDSLPYVPRSNTVATKLPLALDQTPFNVGVVSYSLVEEQDGWVLGDALENVSGLNVQTGSGVFDFFVVRGFDSLSSGLILTDGAPEPETTFYQLYNAERVEVLKGPGGFLYGPNPLAGTVNIVRKQPVPATFGVVGASGGSFDTYEGNVDLNVAAPDGEVSFRLNGFYRQGEGYRDDRDFTAYAINPALTWQISDDSRLNLNFEAQTSDFHPDAGLPLAGGVIPDGVRRRASYAGSGDRSEQEIYRLQGDFEHRFNDRLTLRNKLYFRQLDWLSDGTLLNGVFDPGPFIGLPPGFAPLQVARTQLALDDRQELAGNQLELLWTAETGALTHNLLAGLEITRTTDDFTLDVGLLSSIALIDPVDPGLPGGPVVFAQAGDTTTEVIAPYLIDQIVFNEHLQLLAGARYDEIDFEDAATGTSRSDGELSPMLGIVVSPRDGWTLYANGARSFAPPSPRVAGPRDPEESRQLEVGVRRTLAGGRLSATLAGFEIERDNIAIPDDNGFTQQAGDQRSRGIELELSGELAPGLRSFFSYAYTDSELVRFRELVPVPFGPPPGFIVFDHSGNRSAFAPEHLANLWLARRLGSRFTLGFGGRFVGQQFIAEDNVARLEDYVLLDAALIYAFGDWRMRLNLENLADEEYETRGFGSTSVIPGDPIAATLGFDYRF